MQQLLEISDRPGTGAGPVWCRVRPDRVGRNVTRILHGAGGVLGIWARHLNYLKFCDSRGPFGSCASEGWGAACQREFIEALADLGSVRAACRQMGVGEYGIYALRRHPQAASFRAAWEAALDIGIRRIEDVAMDRALHGVEEPVYHAGAIVGTRRVYNDRLLMFMLRNRAPKRFAADGAARGARGMNAIDQMMLTRLKKEWRAEWEKERALADNQDEDEILDSINAKLDAMQTREAAAKNLLLEDQSDPEDD